MAFEDSSVIITGGSKGIGFSMASVFARNTDRPIVILARDEEELKEAREKLLEEGASKVDTISADLTNENAFDEIDFGQYNPGILINNAGSFLFKELKETTVEEFNGQYKLNAFGAFNITQKVLPELQKLERSLIVNISSMGGLQGLSGSGAYAMSKHALLGYTRSLRKEFRDSDVAVTAINLGQTYSTSWHEVDIDPDKLIDPEDVGRLIISLSKMSPRTVAEEITLAPQGGPVSPM
ncbi:SDR family NAD(P)-dependent oxidoreductase [Gracilimonas mengyeensis]|uniref:3-oxoacyl-[acyl-carrier protein] reductase n=1 Tax=Gracilimonas mengyeensis TaxID=1302730 RepID=A0A521AS06_9BACT|nr:SDR family oxidoreductase [Gracilimonas mengyeensis]SMO37420.1 3-oxoacyl-[acyl-carrier protein] reductase [Gracilimonas mengyeensis]